MISQDLQNKLNKVLQVSRNTLGELALILTLILVNLALLRGIEWLTKLSFF